MCLLLMAEPGNTPDRAELVQASCANPHGFGFAFLTPDGIIRERGMSSRKMIAKFFEMRLQYPDCYAMWHSRYATHGPKNEDNCHPLMVGDDGLTFLGHNGILPTHLPATDKRSDSRIMAEEIIPALGGISALDNDFIWEMLETWVGGSKVVIFTLDPSAKFTVYVLGEKRGHWREGIWYSNYTYVVHKPYVAPVKPIYPLDSEDRYDWVTEKWKNPNSNVIPIHSIVPAVRPMYESGYEDDEFAIWSDVEIIEPEDQMLGDCPWCGNTYDMNSIDMDFDFCVVCASCYDCGGDEPTCMCYSARQKKPKTTTSDDELADELEKFLSHTK